MALAAFQQALATLIRLPEHYREETLPPFLRSLDLTPLERSRLQLLAADRRVVKYGREMMGVRWGGLGRQLASVKRVIPEDFLYSLFRFGFEPRAMQLDGKKFGIRFLEFLLEDSVQAELAHECPRYASNVVKFELARTRFFLFTRLSADIPTASSRLQNLRFATVALDWDIPTWLAQETEPGRKNEPAPEERSTTVLFLATERGGDCRTFAIDAETALFLEAERSGLAGPGVPAAYADLVDLGLCRALQTIREGDFDEFNTPSITAWNDQPGIGRFFSRG